MKIIYKKQPLFFNSKAYKELKQEIREELKDFNQDFLINFSE